MVALVDVGLLAPSTAEWCSCARLFGGEESCVVVSRGTLLDVYASGPPLRLLLRQELAGRVLSVSAVRLSRGFGEPAGAPTVDSLLVLVAPATLCVLEAEPLSGFLRTRSTLALGPLREGLGCIDAPLPPKLLAERFSSSASEANSSCTPTSSRLALVLAFSSVLLAVPLIPGAAAHAGGVLLATEGKHAGRSELDEAEEEAAAAAAKAADAANAAAAGAAIGEGGSTHAAAVAAASALAVAASSAAARVEALANAKAAAATSRAGEEPAPAHGHSPAARLLVQPAHTKPALGSPPPAPPAWWRVNLNEAGMPHAIDAGFLEERLQPTAIVLADPRQTWPGRSDMRWVPPDKRWNPCTCAVAVVSFSPANGRSDVLWRREGLPSNSTRVLPLPKPAGGALVIADNALVWVEQVHAHGVALNGEARCSLTRLHDGPSSLSVSLRGAAAALLPAPVGATGEVTPPRVAISLFSGELIVIGFKLSGNRVIAIEALKIASTSPARSICPVGDGGALFLASSVADSMLLHVGLPAQNVARRAFSPAPPLPPPRAPPRQRKVREEEATACGGATVNSDRADDPDGPVTENGDAADGENRATKRQRTAVEDANVSADGEEPDAEPVGQEPVNYQPRGGSTMGAPGPLATTESLFTAADATTELTPEEAALAAFEAEMRAEEEAKADEAYLYASTTSQTGGGGAGPPARATARILDVLPCVAPPTGMSLVPAPSDMALPAGAIPSPPQLLICCGRGRSGAIALTSPGIRLRTVSVRQVSGCRSVFTLGAPNGQLKEVVANMRVSGSSAHTPRGRAEAAEAANAACLAHRLALVGDGDGSRLFQLAPDGPRVGAGSRDARATLLLASTERGALHVHSERARLLAGDAVVHSVAPPPGRSISAASMAGSLALALLDDGTPWLLKIDEAAADPSNRLTTVDSPSANDSGRHSETSKGAQTMCLQLTADVVAASAPTDASRREIALGTASCMETSLASDGKALGMPQRGAPRLLVASLFEDTQGFFTNEASVRADAADTVHVPTSIVAPATAIYQGVSSNSAPLVSSLAAHDAAHGDGGSQVASRSYDCRLGFFQPTAAALRSAAGGDAAEHAGRAFAGIRTLDVATEAIASSMAAAVAVEEELLYATGDKGSSRPRPRQAHRPTSRHNRGAASKAASPRYAPRSPGLGSGARALPPPVGLPPAVMPRAAPSPSPPATGASSTHSQAPRSPGPMAVSPGTQPISIGVKKIDASVANGMLRGEAADLLAREDDEANANLAPQVLCAGVDEAGGFGIWTLPDWHCIFRSAALSSAPPLLVNTVLPSGERPDTVDSRAVAGHVTEPMPSAASGTGTTITASTAADNTSRSAGVSSGNTHGAHRPILEVMLVSAGAGGESAPMLAAVMAGRGLLLYRALNGAGHGIRFARHALRRLPQGGGASAVADVNAEAGQPGSEAAAAGALGVPAPSAGTTSPARASSPLQLSIHTPLLVHFPRFGPSLTDCILMLGRRPQLLCFLRGSVFVHELRVLGMDARTVVTGAAPFHSAQCPHGVILADANGLVRTCALVPPPSAARPTRYDLDWPVTKLPMRATTHAAAPMVKQKCICVATSTREQRLDLPPPDAPPDMSSLGDSERERLLRPPAPRWHDAYSLQLLDAHSWAALSAYPLKEDEWVMCMRALPIKDEITKQVAVRLVIGTAQQAGEDNICGGRLLIFDVDEASAAPASAANASAPVDVPLAVVKSEPVKGEGTASGPAAAPVAGAPSAAAPSASIDAEAGIGGGRRLKLLFEHEERAPITAIASLQGMLLCAVGQKLCIWSNRAGELRPAGFHYAGFTASCMSTMSNYALVGDTLRGLHLVAWNAKKKCFEARSHRLDARAGFACELLLDTSFSLGGLSIGPKASGGGGGLLLALAEEGARLRLFGYSRQEADASEGATMLPKVAMHMGATMNHMLRLNLDSRTGAASRLPQRGSTSSAVASLPRHAILYTTLDGGLGVLTPTDESTFRRLFFLGQKLAGTLAHVGGLNPRAFRAEGSGAMSEAELSRTADGELLRRFAALGNGAQEKLARQIGTTPGVILENLEELDVLSKLM